MLALTRRSMEKLIFVLPDGREASIAPQIRGKEVRLYCDFPRDVVIKREEVFGKPRENQP